MLFRFIAQVGYTILVVCELLLSLRFILKLFNVPSTAPIVIWLYSVTDKILSPFVGILTQGSVSVIGFTIELTTLLVILIVTICSYALYEIIRAYS